ncbi:carboxymuconolactone decarboxylase family protein [Actinomadura sp. 7K507]|uniref:carboxymuconolactone decarboxylase family protein n=1 Tax=Actinomadura sp. 7K507 TaxID=2530365 RepID=UPI001A9DBFA7|nr:carboxymuconolactone decarboxylase family protein [Actinomadura sp. 7K507]
MRAALAAMVPPDPRHPTPSAEGGRPKALNMLGSFAHHPQLAHAFFTFNGHVMMATTLSLRQRELIILRTATLLKCPYEWAQHLVIGHDAGLTDKDIARIAFGPDAPSWDPLEEALLRAVDELVGGGAIAERTWQVLAEELDTRRLMDLIFTVGAYQTLAYMLRSLDLEMDDDLQQNGGGSST